MKTGSKTESVSMTNVQNPIQTSIAIKPMAIITDLGPTSFNEVLEVKTSIIQIGFEEI